MAFFDHFPFFTAQQINLDWLIKIVKGVADNEDEQNSKIQQNTNDIADLKQKSTVSSVNGKTGNVRLTASDVGAVPVGGETVKSVNGKTGNVVLSAADVGAVPVEGAVISVNGETGRVELSAEDVGAIPVGGETVKSVNGKTGAVTLTAADVGAATPNDIPTKLPNPQTLTIIKDGVSTVYDGSEQKVITVDGGGGTGGGAVDSVNGETGDVILKKLSITVDGEKKEYNGSEDVSIDISGGGAVDSVNGKTGVVVLNAEDVGAVESVNGKTGTAITLNAEDVNAVPVGGETVKSVNAKTGEVVLTADDVGAVPVGSETVKSVNGKTGVVVLTADDVGAAEVGDIPSSLPNPYSLSLVVNGTTTTYNGSASRTVTITTGGGSTVLNPGVNTASGYSGNIYAEIVGNFLYITLNAFKSKGTGEQNIGYISSAALSGKELKSNRANVQACNTADGKSGNSFNVTFYVGKPSGNDTFMNIYVYSNSELDNYYLNGTCIFLFN